MEQIADNVSLKNLFSKAFVTWRGLRVTEIEKGLSTILPAALHAIVTLYLDWVKSDLAEAAFQPDAFAGWASDWDIITVGGVLNAYRKRHDTVHQVQLLTQHLDDIPSLAQELHPFIYGSELHKLTKHLAWLIGAKLRSALSR